MKLTKETMKELSFSTDYNMKILSLSNLNKDWKDISEIQRDKITSDLIKIMELEESNKENISKELLEESYNNYYKLTEVQKLNKEFLCEYAWGIHNTLEDLAQKNKNIKLEDMGLDLKYILNFNEIRYLVQCFFGNISISSQMKFLEMLIEAYNNEYMIKE